MSKAPWLRLLALPLFLMTPTRAAFVDFTSTAWSGANGNNSFSVNVTGVGNVTLQATGAVTSISPAHLTFNGPSCGNGSVGLACQGDGIGINSRTIVVTDIFLDQTDEVDLSEVLTVTFANAVNIVRVDLLNLFAGESVVFSVNGGAFGSSFTGSNTTGGFQATGFAATGVTSLALRGAGVVNLTNSLSLARIEVVPEPSTWALMGAALLALGAMGRRRE